MIEINRSRRRSGAAVRTALAAIMALSAAGCASPLVRPNPLVSQYKAVHASDWQNLARRTVARMPGAGVTDKPAVFVAPGPADMPFAAAYRAYIEEALRDRDFQVVQSASGAVVLNFDVQTFLYGSANGNQKRLVDYASFWTTATGLGAQFRHVSSLDTGLGVAAIVGPITDVLASINDTTRAEVVVTVRVVDDRRVHYVKTESLYVHPSDLPFYWTQLPSSAPQSMPVDASGLAVVSLPVARGYR